MSERHRNREQSFRSAWWGHRALGVVVLALIVPHVMSQTVPLRAQTVNGPATPVDAAQSPEFSDTPLEPEAMLARLRRLWQQQRTAIATARLRFRRFRSGGPFRSLSSVDLHSLLADHDLVASPDELRAVVDAVLGEPLPSDPPWAVREFLVDGERTRERGPGWDHVFDGSTELIHDQSNRFIKLYTPEVGERRWGRMQLHDFRVVPGGEIAGAPLQVVEHTPETVRLRASEALMLTARLSDGVILSVRKGSAADTPVAEVLQRGFVAYEDGIVFPTLRVDATYREDRLSSLSVQILESAEFNLELPDDAFAMPAAKGELVRDRRLESSDRDYRVREPVGDVSKVFGTTESLATGAGRTPPTGFTWTVAIGVLVLVLMAVVLSFRHRQHT